MAGTIKGITIEFRGDTTKLDKALRKVTSESSSLDKRLYEVQQALKFNPRNTELLAQKQGLLRAKVTKTKEKLDALRAAQTKMNAQGTDRASAEYQKLRTQIIKTESQVKNFSRQARKLNSIKLANLSNRFKNFGSTLRGVGTGMSIAGVGLIAVGKRMLEYTDTQSQAENKLTEIYETRMGATDEAAQSTMKLASAIQAEGVIGDEVTLSGAQQLATFAQYPGTIDKLLPAMDNLLVQQKGYNATAEDATGIANMMGKVLGGQPGALKRVGISFSKAQEKVLKYGTEEEKAATLSEVITQNVGNMNKKFAETDAGKIQQAKNSIGDLAEQAGAVLLPALGSIAQFLSKKIIPKLQKFMSVCQKYPIIGKIAIALVAILAIGGPLLVFIGATVSAVGVLAGAFGALDVAMLPIIAIIAAVIVAGILVIKNWAKIKKTAIALGKKMSEIWTSIRKITADVWKAIVANVNGKIQKLKSIIASIRGVVGKVVDAFKAIKNAITKPIRTAADFVGRQIQRIKDFFNGLKLKLPHIRIPHFKLAGKFSLKDRTVPHLSIDWYKKGGIFNSPSVIGVGEAGSEAVVPIDKLWNKIDQMGANIASSIATAGAMAGGPDIHITTFLYPSGPKMQEAIVKAYDRGKRRKG